MPARWMLLVVAAVAVLLLGTGPARAQQSEADVYVAQAILAYEDQRFDDALEHLKEALALDPDNVDALYYTGLVHLARRRIDLAVPPLEKARALSPRDLSVAFQLGVAHFGLEQYDRAEPLLTEVFAAQPRTDGAGYYVGFMRYRKRDYRGALAAFEAGTTTDPNLRQLTRFYSGLALAILGRPGRAVAEVDAALRAQPVSPLTGPAERLRDTIAASRDRERRFRADVRFGILYDTNVPVTPEPSRDPVAENARRRDKQSFGQLIGVRGDYSWLRDGPWEATIGYSFFQVINNDLPEFNIQNHLGTLGVTYSDTVGAMPFQLAGQYAYDYLTLDNDEFLQRHTVAASGALVESARHLSIAQLRFQAKEFSDDSNVPREEVRDAHNWLIGLNHVLRFAAGRHFVRLGYQFDVENADGDNFDYRGHRLQVGAQYTLPWGDTRLKYDYDVHFRDYTRRHSLLPIAAPRTRERADTEQVHAVRIEQPLPWSFTLSGEYQAIVSRSNLPVFSFNRNVFSLILSWQY